MTNFWSGSLVFWCRQNSILHNWQYISQLIYYDFYVKDSFIALVFQQWHWTWKKPTRKQLQKYSITNIKLYQKHVTGVLQVQYEKFKYLCEAHFVSKDLHAKYALREEEKWCVVFISAQLDVFYSLILMTTLFDLLQICVVDLRHSMGFLEFCPILYWKWFFVSRQCFGSKYTCKFD